MQSQFTSKTFFKRLLDFEELILRKEQHVGGTKITKLHKRRKSFGTKKLHACHAQGNICHTQKAIFRGNAIQYAYEAGWSLMAKDEAF